jgi:hypothetical protein
MTVLRARDLTPSELQDLLTQLTFPAEEKVRCWLEAPDGWAFDFWPGMHGSVRWYYAGKLPVARSLTEAVSQLTQGRLFSPTGELKWRCIPALGERCCRVVFLGTWSFQCLEMLARYPDLEQLIRDEATYPLWGQLTKHTPGEWIDLRIPHRLRYPVEAQTPTEGRVIAKLRVEIWNNTRGEPQFIRFCDLIATREE